MKSLPTGAPGRSRTADGAQIHYPGASLLSLLREAYHLKRPEQVVGPSWMRTQMYAIEAKLPPNATQDQIPDMLQSLLADRLKLSVHHEMRPMPTNVLLSGRKVKMRQVEDRNEGLLLKLEPPLVDLGGRGSIIELLDQLNHGLGGSRPWVDMTGLRGLFEIKLAFDMTPDSQLAQSAEPSKLPRLAEALDEQLGLRVEVRNIPTDSVVVDSVDRIPSDN